MAAAARGRKASESLDGAERSQSMLRCRPRGRGGLRIRRGGRAVEGARLESVYTPKRRIEGSNPSLSASNLFTTPP